MPVCTCLCHSTVVAIRLTSSSPRIVSHKSASPCYCRTTHQSVHLPISWTTTQLRICPCHRPETNSQRGYPLVLCGEPVSVGIIPLQWHRNRHRDKLPRWPGLSFGKINMPSDSGNRTPTSSPASPAAFASPASSTSSSPSPLHRLRNIADHMASPISTTSFPPEVVPQAPEDPLFGLMRAYQADPSKDKVDLVGQLLRSIICLMDFSVSKVADSLLAISRVLEHTATTMQSRGFFRLSRRCAIFCVLLLRRPVTPPSRSDSNWGHIFLRSRTQATDHRGQKTADHNLLVRQMRFSTMTPSSITNTCPSLAWSPSPAKPPS